MSELPRRPDLDQLRRQARELLRAATAGDQQALARLHAHSERVTLSAAQLAVAREHGFQSWAGLRARRAPPGRGRGARWRRHLLVAGRNRRHHDSCRGTVTDGAACRPGRGCPGSFARAVGGDAGRPGAGARVRRCHGHRRPRDALQHPDRGDGRAAWRPGRDPRCVTEPAAAAGARAWLPLARPAQPGRPGVPPAALRAHRRPGRPRCPGRGNCRGAGVAPAGTVGHPA